MSFSEVLIENGCNFSCFISGRWQLPVIEYKEIFIALLIFQKLSLSLSLSLFIYIYIKRQNLEKIQLDFNWILNFTLHVPSNFLIFVASELLDAKTEES